jgi:flagellar operon protein
MDIRHLTGRTHPVDPAGKTQHGPQQAPLSPQGESFAEILDKVSKGSESKGIQFSGHALKRLEDRNIALNEQDVLRIQDAVDRAASKGSQDSLILDGDNAFVVNIPNRTVITAVDQMEMRDRVFTQIDSTVLTRPATTTAPVL